MEDSWPPLRPGASVWGCPRRGAGPTVFPICTFAEGRTQPAQDPGAVMATTAACLDTRRVTAAAISLSDSRRGRKTPSCEPLLPPPAQMPETHKPPLLPPWDSRSGLELPPCPPCALGVPPLPPETPGAGHPLHLHTPIKGTRPAHSEERRQASMLKTALAPNILNPHK